jgi:large subunit ribosomal protein L14
MLQQKSKVMIADNTGAKWGRYIMTPGPTRRFGRIGDVVKIHVRESSPDASVKKGEVHTAVIVRTVRSIHRADGSYLRFDDNAVVILDQTLSPKGTRIFGPVARELRNRFMKIISLASEVL